MYLGARKAQTKNREYQTAGVLVYFKARTEQTKRTDNTRQKKQRIPDSWSPGVPRGPKRTDKKADNTRQLES